MSSLRFDVRMLPPTEPAAQQAMEAARLLGMGDRAGAEHLYREATALPVAHATSLVNLAAIGIGLGEWQAARAHAMRALQQDRANADAWVNLGAASWHAEMRRDAAQSTHRALELAPAMEAAALNLNLMYQAVGQTERARAMLDEVLVRNPGAPRLQQSMAEVCRLLGDADATHRHALLALSALLPEISPAPGPEDGTETADPAAQARLLATMTDACDRLQAAGIDHHLVGGVVIGIVREGQPFPGDKDIDIGVDFDADRERIAAAFADGYTYMRTPREPEARRWCMGYVHDATGIGVDLFFKQRVGGRLRVCLGWPDDLLFDLPEYRVEAFRWQGRDWPMPAPLEEYLNAEYGDDWRLPWREVAGHRFDKRWQYSQLSSPSLLAESLPRAINLGLLRVIVALRRQRWPKALALCDQLLARAPIAQVEAVRARLLASGIR